MVASVVKTKRGSEMRLTANEPRIWNQAVVFLGTAGDESSRTTLHLPVELRAVQEVLAVPRLWVCAQ